MASTDSCPTDTQKFIERCSERIGWQRAWLDVGNISWSAGKEAPDVYRRFINWCALVFGPLCLACESISRGEEERPNAVLYEVGCPVSFSTSVGERRSVFGMQRARTLESRSCNGLQRRSSRRQHRSTGQTSRWAKPAGAGAPDGRRPVCCHRIPRNYDAGARPSGGGSPGSSIQPPQRPNTSTSRDRR